MKPRGRMVWVGGVALIGCLLAVSLYPYGRSEGSDCVDISDAAAHERADRVLAREQARVGPTFVRGIDFDQLRFREVLRDGDGVRVMYGDRRTGRTVLVIAIFDGCEIQWMLPSDFVPP